MDEHKGDDNARQHSADGKLCVGIVARRIPFIRSTEERGGADLRRKDRGQHCPLWDAPIPDGETLHRFVAPALVKADANYCDKVRENNPTIEQPRHKASVIHDPARNATGEECLRKSGPRGAPTPGGHLHALPSSASSLNSPAGVSGGRNFRTRASSDGRCRSSQEL